MPRFDHLVSAVRDYRKQHGASRADTAIRSHATGDITIDTASDDMLERVLESSARPATDNNRRPQHIGELNHTEIWNRYNQKYK